MRRTVAVDGSAAPDVVWSRYYRPASWSGWAPQITGVDYAADVLVAGARGTVRSGPVRVPFTVDSVDVSARHWSWRVPMLRLEHGVDAAVDGGGTRTTLVVDGPALVVWGYLPVARWALRRLVRP